MASRKLSEIAKTIRSKNAGVDKLEPFEVRDARSGEDPVREKA